jgi:P-type Cu+ transporter
VGIAVGSGTDLARECSDVTLLGDSLSRIPWLLELSSVTLQIIRQNLWWAFGYNTVAVGLAFMGCVHPLIAATAMFVSSASVIANSTRLLRGGLAREANPCWAPEG